MKLLGVRVALLALAIVCAAALRIPNASADPRGGAIVSGQAVLQQLPGHTTITQFSDRLILNWQSFNLAPGQQIRFVQPGALAAALNRISGVDPTLILGSLEANGRIFLVNPNGIVFGQGSAVNVGGLLASTLSIDGGEFEAGQMNLQGSGSAGAIVNRGRIQASDGGFILLVAPLVNNQGTLVANLGSVSLMGGTRAEVTIDAGGLLSVALPSNARALPASNADVLRLAVGQQGVHEAGTEVSSTGTIEAHQIELSAGHVQVGGRIDAGASGRVVIDPEDLFIVDGNGTSPDTIGSVTLSSITAGTITLQAEQSIFVQSHLVALKPGVSLALDAIGGDVRFSSPANGVVASGQVTVAAGANALLGSIRAANIDVSAGHAVQLGGTLTAQSVLILAGAGVQDAGETSVQAVNALVHAGGTVQLNSAVTGRLQVAGANVWLTNTGSTSQVALDIAAPGSVALVQHGPALLDRVEAGKDLQTTVTGGDLTVGHISVGGDLSLTATAGSILAQTPQSEIQATGARLNARKVIGTIDDPLNVEIGHNGLTVSAQGQQQEVSVSLSGSLTRLNVQGEPPGFVSFLESPATQSSAQGNLSEQVDENIDVANLLELDLAWLEEVLASTEVEAPFPTDFLDLFSLADMETDFSSLRQSGDVLGAIRMSANVSQLLLQTRPHGWQAEAMSAIDYAMTRSRQIGYRPGVILALQDRADMREAAGDKSGALVDRVESMASTEQYVSDVGAANFNGGPLAARTSHLYSAVASAQAEKGDAAAALETEQRQVLLQNLAVLSPNAARPADKRGCALLEKAAVAQTEAGRYEQELVGRRARPSAQQDRAAIERLTELVAASRAEYVRATAALATVAPAYEALLAVRPTSLADVQKSIPRDTVLVQLLPTDTRLYLFVVTANHLRVKTVAVTRDELDRLVDAVRGEIVAFSHHPRAWSDRIGAEPDALQRDLMQLHALLVDPVEDEISHHDVVAFIPTGRLLYLPFQALARAKDGRLQYLIARKRVVILAKSSDVLAVGHPLAGNEDRLVAFGNPDGSLEGAQREAYDVGELFESRDVHVRDAATKGRLRILAPRATLLHLATHGILDGRKPAQSYMVMAGRDAHGRLTIPEIVGEPLGGVRLATLSACQTALGQAVPGVEITSLAEAFSIAGSHSVIASLWSVDDASTHDLMLTFYHSIKEGQGIGQSLRAAQMRLIGTPRYAHPFYWAPFILIGDWR